MVRAGVRALRGPARSGGGGAGCFPIGAGALLRFVASGLGVGAAVSSA